MIGNVSRLAQIFFPSIMVLYIVACGMWNVESSLLALAIFAVAALIGNIYVVRSERYAGVIEVKNSEEGKTVYSLMLESHPDDWNKKKRLTFAVEDTRD